MTKRAALFYFFVLCAVGLGVFFILRAGNQLPAPVLRLSPQSSSQTTPHLSGAGDYSFSASVESSLWDNANDPLSRLFLQLFIVIVVSYLVGWIFTRFGQPAVVGEMMAGVLLGPSVFGLLAPAAFQFVFAAPSLGALRLFSQIGVCLFMFTVGMEMDVAELRRRAHTAFVVSHASMIAPYFLGMLLALFLAVDEAVALAIPDEAIGNTIRAIVTLGNGRSLTSPELKRHCAEKLPALHGARRDRVS